MYFSKKKAKFYLIALTCIVIVYYVKITYFVEPIEYVDSQLKLQAIEESIRLNANQSSCQIPNLPIYSPEMMSFIKDEPPITCDEQEDWVTCYLSTCSIKQSIIIEYGQITCDFSEIVRTDDFTIKYNKPIRKISNEKHELIQSDFAHVKCWNDDWDRSWTGIVFGIKQQQQQHHQQQQQQHQEEIEQSINNVDVDEDTNQKINILMYGFDSLSKNSFIRKLPDTYKYLRETLNVDILNGYNIVGDGTPQALIPILTGFTELELPETRRRMKPSNYVNVYPFIWKQYEEMNYITGFNEDIPSVGTFSYRLNGFLEQPTQHYMRSYYMALEPLLSSYKRLCVGQKPRHQVMLDYTMQIMKSNSKPKFIFSFHGELSHDSINLVGVADQDIKNWLTELKINNILNNTILILMSDHGNRFAEVRNTLQGKLEERLPFFSFVFPNWFKEKYHEQYENFQQNINHLTTPFDIHATLDNILRMQSPFYKKQSQLKSNKQMNRAISLFAKHPTQHRTCSEAYIEPHWCVCLNWHQLTDYGNNELIQRAAHTVVDQINKILINQRDICSHLTLYEITWAAILAPHDNLLRFKQAKDGDGFLPDLSPPANLDDDNYFLQLSKNSKTSSTTTIKRSTNMYQVKIIVKPGKSIFEASVTHNLEKNEFSVKMTDISRVNKYGSQAACIMEINPEIRKYCYCKNQPNNQNL